MKREKRPTEPGYYWYSEAIGPPEVVMVRGCSPRLYAVRYSVFRTRKIETLKGWWGPKISELDPQ